MGSLTPFTMTIYGIYDIVLLSCHKMLQCQV